MRRHAGLAHPGGGRGQGLTGIASLKRYFDAKVSVGLLQPHDTEVAAAQFLQHRPHGLDMVLGVLVAGVHDVEQQPGLAGLLEGGLERRDELRRQFLDETHRVRQGHRAPHFAQVQLARRGVQGGKQLIGGIDFTAGQAVEQGQVLVEWDPYTFSILTEEAGQVRFKDILEGITVHEEVDEVTGLSRLIIVDSPDEKKQPAIEIKSAKDGKVNRRYHMPVHAHLMVQDGENVSAGDALAKIPRETTKTKDITGGLPRVVELFEARKPRETAVISEIDGIVKHGGIVKGQRKIMIVPDEPGAEQRSGRWWWEKGAPKECGMHCAVETGGFEHELEVIVGGKRD